MLGAQNFTSSEFPIFIITTDIDPYTGNHLQIQDEPKIGANLKILYLNDSTRNFLSNQNDSYFLNYNGRIAIETRGSTSQSYNKKSYAFETRLDDNETNNNVSLVGMPDENDWILTAMNDEPSYLRDCLSFCLYEKLGYYSPRTKYCEVIVNGNYRGLYYLTEKIKVDKNRVNIEKLESNENIFPNLSGGYIVKADKTTGGDEAAWTTSAYNYYEDVNYIHHAPKPELITNSQAKYIRNYFDTVFSLVESHNQDVLHGFPAYIDIMSFVDFMIMGEFSSNVDIYQKSTFFHKDRGGKLRAGPIWDYNLAYGYDFGQIGRSGYDVLQFENNDNTGSDFWHQMYEDDKFYCILTHRWKELTISGAPLNYYSVVHIIDSIRNMIAPAVNRDRNRWSKNYNYLSHINSMKQWLQNRYLWLNNIWKDNDECFSEEVPSLVISKINYHPISSYGYSSKDLEFIGITNNSSDTVDVSGCFFRELGITYTFPENSKIAPLQEVYIVSNPESFYGRYGQVAYGRFLRSLSNKFQKLVLADPWGRDIDDVTYYDSLPWPLEADGQGSFLSLIDLNLDNSLPSSWTTESEFVGVQDITDFSEVITSPNPTHDFSRITSLFNIVDGYVLYDVSGREISCGNVHDYNFTVNLLNCRVGVYFLKINFINKKSTTIKILKN